jgi:hypothetical protein
LFPKALRDNWLQDDQPQSAMITLLDHLGVIPTSGGVARARKKRGSPEVDASGLHLVSRLH